MHPGRPGDESVMNLSRILRPRFRLSTFLLAVGVLALGLGWWSDHDRQRRRLREADTMIGALHEAARDEEEMLLLSKPPLIRYQTVRAFLDDCFQADLTASHGWQHFWPTLQSIKGTAIATESVPELAKLLGSSDPQVRQRAAAALGEFAVRPDVSLPALADALDDSDAHVQRYAATAIGQYGPEATRIVPALMEAANDGSSEVQCSVARSVWRISHDRRAIDLTAKLLRSDDVGIRCDAADVLREIGPPAQSTAPILAEMVSDKNTSVSQAAVDAMLAVAPQEESYRVLLAAFTDLAGMPRRTAALALKRLDMDLNRH